MSGTSLLLAGLGELLGEKVGVLNVGLEGIMLVGGASGYAIMTATGSVNAGLLGGGGAGLVYVALLFSVPVVLLHTNQVLTGFALWLLGIGVSKIIGSHYEDVAPKDSLPDVHWPWLSDVPFIGKVVFAYPWPVYAAAVLPLLAWLVLSRTRHGLSVRAVGEAPDAAEAVGLDVRWRRMFYSSLTGFFAGAGGAFLTVVYVGRWSPGVTAGAGWIALAIVIVSNWRPAWLVVAAYLFGVLASLSDVGGALGWPIRSEFLAMVPYLGTLLALALWLWPRKARRGRLEAPAALGGVWVR
jgi:simple sugar transport system permease protein